MPGSVSNWARAASLEDGPLLGVLPASQETNSNRNSLTSTNTAATGPQKVADLPGLVEQEAPRQRIGPVTLSPLLKSTQLPGLQTPPGGAGDNNTLQQSQQHQQQQQQQQHHHNNHNNHHHPSWPQQSVSEPGPGPSPSSILKAASALRDASQQQPGQSNNNGNNTSSNNNSSTGGGGMEVFRRRAQSEFAPGGVEGFTSHGRPRLPVSKVGPRHSLVKPIQSQLAAQLGLGQPGPPGGSPLTGLPLSPAVSGARLDGSRSFGPPSPSESWTSKSNGGPMDDDHFRRVVSEHIEKVTQALEHLSEHAGISVPSTQTSPNMPVHSPMPGSPGLSPAMRNRLPGFLQQHVMQQGHSFQDNGAVRTSSSGLWTNNELPNELEEEDEDDEGGGHGDHDHEDNKDEAALGDSHGQFTSGGKTAEELASSRTSSHKRSPSRCSAEAETRTDGKKVQLNDQKSVVSNRSQSISAWEEHTRFSDSDNGDRRNTQTRVTQYMTARNLEGLPFFRRWARQLGQDRRFDIALAGVIFLNALAIGAQADWSIRNLKADVPLVYTVSDMLFTIVFSIELAVRIVDEGKRFVSPRNPNIRWNAFDSFVVFSAWVEEATAQLSSSLSSTPDVSAIRVLRIVRLVRILRVVRVMRFFRELRTMVQGIVSSARSLVWCMLLLLILIFIFAVCFLQITTEYLSSNDGVESEPLLSHFGSLLGAIYTLFLTITGGLNWGEPCALLMEIHAAMAVLFAIYIAFSVLCVLNIVTGVFVENANQITKLDADNMIMEELATRDKWVKDMEQVFANADVNGCGALNMKEFEKYSQDVRVQAYFRKIGLNVEKGNARALFHLIDINGDGAVDLGEFVEGCTQFLGTARQLDIARLRNESQGIRRDLHTLGALIADYVISSGGGGSSGAGGNGQYAPLEAPNPSPSWGAASNLSGMTNDAQNIRRVSFMSGSSQQQPLWQVLNSRGLQSQQGRPSTIGFEPSLSFGGQSVGGFPR